MWFGHITPDSGLAVTVPAFEVLVSRAVADPAGPAAPTYGAFELESRLKVIDIFYGSSVAGQSYAKLKTITGEPFSTQQNVENSDQLGKGDRVIIRTQHGVSPVYLFAGYMVTGQLEIGDEAEGLIYRVAGPEWAWGGSGDRGGAFNPIYGQRRRKVAAEDAWVDDLTIKTAFADQFLCPDEPTVFNPQGRMNMGYTDVKLDGNSSPVPIEGGIFDIPDRKIADAARARLWSRRAALKYLLTLYNTPATTGIAAPVLAEWTAIEALLGDDKSMRGVSVEGLGLWEAMIRVLGSDFAFFIDPRPPGAAWSGFTGTIFSRSTGAAASFHLNVRDTVMSEATPGVARLHAVKSVDKTVTKVSVVGRAVRHVKLRYHGGATPTLSDADKKLALQHGWVKGDGDLATFAVTGVVGRDTIESKSGAVQAEWRDRYVVGGKEFPKYRHVFRLFCWNEDRALFHAAGGADATKPIYATTTASYYAPDLANIVDGVGFDASAVAGLYSRRRRRLLDTAYFDGKLDSWRRVRPTLFIQKSGMTYWHRVSSGMYQIDPERAGVWITASDLANWDPFKNVPDETEPKVADEDSFAAMLHAGTLRMMVEASVEADLGLVKTAARQTTAGSPHVRETVVIGREDYVKTLSYADGITSPMGLTAATIDQSADAQAMADHMRDAGQDEQIHASILASAASTRQPIGSMILATTGRVVNLTSSSGRGAQIVAIRIDPTSCKWEYLTETAALETRALDRIRMAQRRKHNERGRTSI